MGGENPYSKMTFDKSGFKKASDKISSSFDSLISNATNQAGMASGFSGGDVSRVAAETYVNAAGQRDQSLGQLETQLASAESQFNTDKQNKVVQYEAERAGPLDFIFNTFLPAASGVADMFFPPAAIVGVGSKALGGLTGKPSNTQGQQTQTPVAPEVSSNTPQLGMTSSQAPNTSYLNNSAFKLKNKTNPFDFINKNSKIYAN